MQNHNKMSNKGIKFKTLIQFILLLLFKKIFFNIYTCPEINFLEFKSLLQTRNKFGNKTPFILVVSLFSLFQHGDKNMDEKLGYTVHVLLMKIRDSRYILKEKAKCKCYQKA